METYGWDEENFATTREQRGIELQDYLRRLHKINTEGLPVRLSVAPADADSPGRMLLQIVCHARRGFTHLASDARAVASFFRGERYHISLCFVPEVRDWEAYQRVRQRYDGKVGLLSVHVHNSEAKLVPGSPLSDEILADRDVWDLHRHGHYWKRDLHVSL